MLNIYKPKFSIIMPTYNRAFCICNAIDSLLAQKYEEYELIIVDDGSTDNTKEILYNKYSKYFESGKFIYKYITNSGVSNARNVGLTLSSNEWIAYLDSDNTIAPEFLSTFKKSIIKNKKSKCFYARIKRSNGSSEGKNFDYVDLQKGNFIDLGVFVHHKSLIDECGIFDISLKRLVDWDLILRYTQVYTPVFVNKILLKYSSNDEYKRISNSESFDIAYKIIQEKFNNRIAIFAHFDKKNIIQDYVIYYLKELKKVASNIIFVSDCDLSRKELDKISNIVTTSIAHRHGEYDFGSYKRGYIWAKENGYLDKCSELILCNDSCYGPLYPLENVFKKMRKSNADFWGLTLNPNGYKIFGNAIIKTSNVAHIQSYFVVLKHNVFSSDIFNTFLLSVEAQKLKRMIIVKYEEGLTQILANAGFKYDVYCDLSKSHYNAQGTHFIKLCFIDKCPFIKISLFFPFRKNTRKFKFIKKYTNYNLKLIKKHINSQKNFINYIFSISKIDNTRMIITLFGIKFKYKIDNRLDLLQSKVKYQNYIIKNLLKLSPELDKEYSKSLDCDIVDIIE